MPATRDANVSECGEEDDDWAQFSHPKPGRIPGWWAQGECEWGGLPDGKEELRCRIQHFMRVVSLAGASYELISASSYTSTVTVFSGSTGWSRGRDCIWCGHRIVQQAWRRGDRARRSRHLPLVLIDTRQRVEAEIATGKVGYPGYPESPWKSAISSLFTGKKQAKTVTVELLDQLSHTRPPITIDRSGTLESR